MNAVTIPMTREQFTAEQARCAAFGFKISGDEGSQDGIAVPFGTMGLSWKYDDSAQAVTVTVLHKPMIDPMGTILDQIRKDLTS